jgi:hypothetical protein
MRKKISALKMRVDSCAPSGRESLGQSRPEAAAALPLATFLMRLRRNKEFSIFNQLLNKTLDARRPDWL